MALRAKDDGFRALAVIENGRAQLLSRNGHPFASFADLAQDIVASIRRTERLVDRKQELRRLLAKISPPSLLRYVDHVDASGTTLFQRVCEMDLEGIVAKLKFGNYVTEREQSTWVKILNRQYSQMAGREELFERDRHKEPVAGWHSCALACAELK